MIHVNGKNYTAEYILRAIAALEAANVPDNGEDGDEICLVTATEKGNICVSIAPDEYHSVYIDLTANAEQCKALGLQSGLPEPGKTVQLPLATIEVADAATEASLEAYVKRAGKSAGCPRVFLYDKMDSDCSHIVLIDGNGLKFMEN